MKKERVGTRLAACEPEWGSYWVCGVARCDVFQENLERVDAETMGWNDDFVPLEKSVSFVTWESEFVDVVAYDDSVASRHLLPVL